MSGVVGTVAVAATGALCPCAARGEQGEAERGGLTCGLASLRVLLHVLAIPTLSGDWQAVVEQYGNRGMLSAAEVLLAGRAMGAELEGWEMTLDELAARHEPAIIHFKTGHFATFLDVARGVARWVEPGGVVQVAPTEELQGRLSGYCLLRARPDDHDRHQSCLHLAPLHYEAGRPTEGRVVRHTVSCRNTGREPVRVVVARTSAECSAALVGPAVIQPGTSREIIVQGRVPDDPCAVRFWAEVVSSDPVHPVQYLTMDALGLAPIRAQPPRLAGVAHRGQGARLEVKLIAPVRTAVRAVATDPAVLRVSLGMSREAVSEELGTRILPITIGVPDSLPRGVLNGQLTITTDDLETPVVTVPIVLRVLGHVTTSPPDVFFGRVKRGAAAQEEIVVSAPPDLGLRVTDANAEAPWLQVHRPTRRPDGSYAVIVRVKTGGCALGPLQGTVTISTQVPGEETIAVPVYAEVAEQ